MTIFLSYYQKMIVVTDVLDFLPSWPKVQLTYLYCCNIYGIEKEANFLTTFLLTNYYRTNHFNSNTWLFF